MNSRPLMLLRLDTSATEEIGSTPRGALSMFPVAGGSFEGERLRGKVLAGGALNTSSPSYFPCFGTVIRWLSPP